ncbi:MAG: DUF6308 family protein [Acidimicrobiales bacterium]
MSKRSITEIKGAKKLLDEYCDPGNGYAWPLYDEDPSPRTLCGADLTAPALVSYPIRGSYLNQMGQSGTPYAELVHLMEVFAATSASSTFAQLPAETLVGLRSRASGDEVDGPNDWRALVHCFDAAQQCKGITSVAVTKILHRKRPDLVPINDSRLRAFYGSGTGYSSLFQSIHSDLNRSDAAELLNALVDARTTPQGRPMTHLRALDIVVWMHMGGSEA